MSRMIFDYTKKELETVSVQPDLFKKRLKKATKNLLPYEMEQLKKWLSSFTKNRPELQDCSLEITDNNQKGIC